jgi:hypothetical protein
MNNDDWIPTEHRCKGCPGVKGPDANRVVVWLTKSEARSATKDRVAAYMIKKVYFPAFKFWRCAIVDDYGNVLTKHGATRPLTTL